MMFFHLTIDNTHVGMYRPASKDRDSGFFIKPGVLTLAVEGTSDPDIVNYGYAWCSPRDQFNRRLGRTIAVSRLRNAFRSCHVPIPIKDLSAEKLALRVINDLMLNELVPRWTYNNAVYRARFRKNHKPLVGS